MACVTFREWVIKIGRTYVYSVKILYRMEGNWTACTCKRYYSGFSGKIMHHPFSGNWYDCSYAFGNKNNLFWHRQDAWKENILFVTSKLHGHYKSDFVELFTSKTLTMIFEDQRSKGWKLNKLIFLKILLNFLEAKIPQNYLLLKFKNALFLVDLANSICNHLNTLEKLRFQNV